MSDEMKELYKRSFTPRQIRELFAEAINGQKWLERIGRVVSSFTTQDVSAERKRWVQNACDTLIAETDEVINFLEDLLR